MEQFTGKPFFCKYPLPHVYMDFQNGTNTQSKGRQRYSTRGGITDIPYELSAISLHFTQLLSQHLRRSRGKTALRNAEKRIVPAISYHKLNGLVLSSNKSQGTSTGQ
jgi:hypothetical protein